MRQFKYYTIIVATIVAFVAMAGFIFRDACMDLPEAKMTIGVHSDDFERPTKTAMSLMNAFVGCEFLVPGKDVRIMSTDGEPCGLAFHRAIDDGHSASSYRCDSGGFEVHVSKPGDIHVQTCIAAHEIGHVAGLEDPEKKNQLGIMNQYYCPTPIILSDDEVKFLSKKFCK